MTPKEPTRRAAPLTAVAYERELAALRRLNKAGVLTNRQFNEKCETLVTRLREGR